MTIIFFGSDPWFSPPVLETLLSAGFEVPIAVAKGAALTAPNSKIIQAKSADDISVERLTAVLDEIAAPPEADRNDRLTVHGSRFTKDNRPEAIVLASFGPPFLAAEVLNWPKYGCLNVHASLLPRWRGASPVFAAIAAGDKQTGVSIMRMTEEIDRGPVLGQKKTLIKSGVSWLKLTRSLLAEANKESPCFDNRKTMTKRLGKLGGKLIVETLKKLETGQITETPQPQKSPTPYTRKLTKKDGRIDWRFRPGEIGPERSRRIERFIRAVTPWPGAETNFKFKISDLRFKTGKLKILKTHLEKLPRRDCRGRLRRPRNDVNLVIDLVQLPGKNPVSWKQFLAGRPGAELG